LRAEKEKKLAQQKEIEKMERLQREEEKERERAEKEKKRAKQKEIEKIRLEEGKAAKAEASKLKRQRELEKMRAKSIEMQAKVSLITILCMIIMKSKMMLIHCLLLFFEVAGGRKGS